MKILVLLLSIFYFSYGLEETEQLQVIHPLQNTKNTQKLLNAMQNNIQTYLYQTPLSSYAYFNKYSTRMKSQALITWVHGNIYIETLAAAREPNIRATLNNAQYTHLGDYRYDIFTLLSDLLLKMQSDSDFSGSKEKAILGTLIDGYFERMKNQKLQCPCIEDALSDVKENDLLLHYTKVLKQHRSFNSNLPTLSKLNAQKKKTITQEINLSFSKFELLPVKDIVMNEFGDYLLLCEGKTKDLQDDVILTLSANTVPVSYQINAKMKNDYLSKSLSDREEVLSSFNQTDYASAVRIKNQDFFVSKLAPSLKLRPQSEKTIAYKNYASALGFILASFHSNPNLSSCQNFSKKINTQVRQRVVKTELISMAYAYNETLEQKWEDFTYKDFLSLK